MQVKWYLPEPMVKAAGSVESAARGMSALPATGAPPSLTEAASAVGRMTVAVVLSGTVTSSVNALPSTDQRVAILPRIESYVACAEVSPGPGRGRMMMWRKPGADGSTSMPATVSNIHSPQEPSE